MNYKRILLGGLVAGLVINASEFLLNAVVLNASLRAEVAAHNLVFAGWSMAAYVLIAFFWGFWLAWGYAALRPRLGAGFRTALAAAASVWLLSHVVSGVSLHAMGLSDGGTALLGLVWGAVELVIAAALAGAIYREGEAAMSPAT